MEEKRFTDKVVLVTGTTSGIGRTTAAAFAREGARVVTAARREKLRASLVEEITEAGGDACFIKTDIRNPDDVDNLFNQIFERYDRLATPEEIAGAVLMLCSDAATFMTGKEIVIAGGQGIRP